jgi:hypothetical protein
LPVETASTRQGSKHQRLFNEIGQAQILP